MSRREVDDLPVGVVLAVIGGVAALAIAVSGFVLLAGLR